MNREIELTGIAHGRVTPISEMRPGDFWISRHSIGREDEVIPVDELRRRLEAAESRLREAEVGTPYCA